VERSVEQDEPVADVDATAVEETPASAGELVARAGDEGDVFRVMDEYDATQIMDELQGRPADVMVYSFQSGGKTQTGLSYRGVAEIARTMNEHGMGQIRVSGAHPPIVTEAQETDEAGATVTYIEATVYAEDTKNGGGNWGTARQPKFQTFRDSSKAPKLDAFARAKALSKAQRNAMLPLLPVAFAETQIALMLQNPVRVKEIRAGLGQAPADLPPALTDERAVELKNQIRGVYRDIRAIDPMAMPPGRFNVKLRRAEVEHAALEELLEELRSMRKHKAGEAGTT
jgi:hypothetical protein